VFPSTDCVENKGKIERHLLEHCLLLTISQRCADWFILRQFRVTGTNASQVILADSIIREKLGLRETASRDSESFSNERILRDLVQSWFSTSRSTDEMKRGTANESAVLAALKRKRFVKALYEGGMFAKRETPWLACSPDGICLLEIDGFNFGNEDETYTEAVIATVEIKTSVTDSSLSKNLGCLSADPVVCHVGDDSFRKHVPEIHVGQILQQMLVLGVIHVVYVAASETGIIYIVIAKCDSEILETCKLVLTRDAELPVSWAHADVVSVPDFADRRTLKLIRSRIDFWKLVNNHVREKGPFPPLKLFKHGCQAFYSKTKGGVDGSAQARAIFRSSTSSLKWEQKIVSQTFKTLTVNSFISWRITENKRSLENKDTFKGLDHFRGTLNTLQSLSDFALDAAVELLEYAEKLQKNRVAQPQTRLSSDETLRLNALAVQRKRKRIEFLTGSDGTALRLDVENHEQKQQKEQKYCALCGNHPTPERGEYRGRRSSFKCSRCDVHLCIRIYPGLRKSCLSVWHSSKDLQPRKTPRPAACASNAGEETPS
jgi:transposase-like protein